MGLLSIDPEFIIDDDFKQWTKELGVELKKQQHKNAEIVLFQELFREIQRLKNGT